jgi:Macrocin-O-methyltransferase (TylF).
MNLEERIAQLEQRISDLEHCRYRDNNVRFEMIRRIDSYLVSADLKGDYCEFGVGQGKTFSYAVHTLHKRYPHMRFWGFDTFEGMPEAQGLDAQMPFDTGHTQGNFSCPEQSVRGIVMQYSPDIAAERLNTVPGLFTDTFKTVNDKIYNVSVAFIDPIYYESTVTVLDFLTDKITTGSVIIFDDWFAMRNLPDYGNQKACNEWVAQHNIRLSPFFSFGGTGMVFTVQ